MKTPIKLAIGFVLFFILITYYMLINPLYIIPNRCEQVALKDYNMENADCFVDIIGGGECMCRDYKIIEKENSYEEKSIRYESFNLK